MDDELFAALREAIYKYELVLFKGQHDLKPIEHFNFVKRFDPNAPDLHGHGTLETVRKTHKGAPTLLAAVRLPNFMEFNRVLISYPQVSTHMIPGAPGVRLVAAGYQGKDHYGLKDIEFRTSTILNTHANPPTQEEIDAGITRFGRWHIDFMPRSSPHFAASNYPLGPNKHFGGTMVLGERSKSSQDLPHFILASSSTQSSRLKREKW